MHSSRRPPPSTMEEILTKFGDNESTLLDQFERLSFEVQLTQAILGRSLSEPTASTRSTYAPTNKDEVVLKQTTSNSRFHKVLKMLMKPILEVGKRKKTKKKRGETDEIAVDRSSSRTTVSTTDTNRYGFPVYSKAFSRSVRVG